MRPLEITATVFFRLAEVGSTMLAYAAMGSVFGPQWTPIMAVCEILASLTVSRKILDVLTRPQNNGKFVRRETFDLCGVFHGYHHSSTSSKGGDASSMVPTLPSLLH